MIIQNTHVTLWSAVPPPDTDTSSEISPQAPPLDSPPLSLPTLFLGQLPLPPSCDLDQAVARVSRGFLLEIPPPIMPTNQPTILAYFNAVLRLAVDLKTARWVLRMYGGVL